MTITGTIPSAIANFLKTEDESLNGIEIKGNDIDVILTDNGTYTELYGVGMGNGSYEIIEIDDNLNLLPEYEKGDVVSNDVLKKMFSTVINSSLILSFNPLGKIKYGIIDKAVAVGKGVKKGVNKVKEAGKWVADIISPEDAQNWIRKQKGFERVKVGKVDRIGGLTGGYYAVLAGNPADKKFSVWKLYRNGNEYRTLKADFFGNSQDALEAYNKLTKKDVQDSSQKEEQTTDNERQGEEVNQTEEKNTLELGEDGWQYTDDGVAYKITESTKKKKKKSKYNGCNVSGYEDGTLISPMSVGDGGMAVASEFYSGGFRKDNAPKINYNGFVFYAQTRGYVSSVISGVKTNNPKYVNEIAEFLAPQLKQDCTLIPAPQHTGKAVYTLEICNRIKSLRTDLNIEIADVLSETPRESTLRDSKKTMSKKELNDLDLGINVMESEFSGNPKYFVDNTISTGKTFFSVQKLIPDIQPLAFSLGAVFLNSVK